MKFVCRPNPPWKWNDTARKRSNKNVPGYMILIKRAAKGDYGELMHGEYPKSIRTTSDHLTPGGVINELREARAIQALPYLRKILKNEKSMTTISRTRGLDFGDDSGGYFRKQSEIAIEEILTNKSTLSKVIFRLRFIIFPLLLIVAFYLLIIYYPFLKELLVDLGIC